jgi:hypothetical protein
MADANVLGPGAYADTGETATRPAHAAPLDVVNDTWFEECDPAIAASGTSFDAVWANWIMAQLRYLIRKSGASQITSGAGVDDMVGEAAARYASGGIWCSDGGTANAAVLTPTGNFIGPKSLFDGMQLNFRPAAKNTGAKTINYNAIGAKDCVDPDGNALLTGDMPTTRETSVRYNLAADKFYMCPWSAGPRYLEREVFFENDGVTTQAIASGSSFVKLTNWHTTTVRNTLRDGSSSCSAGRLTIGARDAGMWQFTYNANIFADSANEDVALYKNGAQVHSVGPGGSAGDDVVFDGYHMIELAAADYIEIFVRHNSGSSRSTGAHAPFLRGWRLRETR